MVDYFSHIELLYERQLLPCCFRSLAIFHVPMEHVEMRSHFPAATEIHSSNPCRAWVIVFRLNVTICSFLKLYTIWEIISAEADFYPFFPAYFLSNLSVLHQKIRCVFGHGFLLEFSELILHAILYIFWRNRTKFRNRLWFSYRINSVIIQHHHIILFCIN